MDFSPGVALLYICCLSPGIPTVVVGSIYAVICLLPEEKRANALASKKLSVILTSIFIVIFILTCALLLYWSKDI